MNAVTAAARAPESTTPAAPSATTVEAVLALYELPFMDLVFKAAEVHRAHFDPSAVQRSSLLSVKTGGCSEDCGYCSQSKRREAEVREAEFKLQNAGLMAVDEVVAAAQAAKDAGASRFCMGAAWRGPKDRDLARVKEMVQGVKALGLETCVTLGMLKEGQAEELKAAGLDYYNHNLDTDPEYYSKIVTTHTADDRLDTLGKVREAGLKVCSGGIIGMGESRRNRAALIAKLANLNPPPESVPINNLVPIPGTALADQAGVDAFEFIRTIAVARIVMPASFVRLSAGRQRLSDEGQALAFLAGANSIFYGEQLLTTGNPDVRKDAALFERLDLTPI